MAEKKFFVDINLQGSALVNAKLGTNTGIGSVEGAFGYDSTAHRLQYFDGTTTKEVANLSDISAVTGGLILQGGYDAATGTPEITDGTALKGFFWVVTEAGTFLGESVQVGDSLVAKVDEAGASSADWLILQGNIVIATDSIDGISRLATQTEVNDGTEAGAVVVTPATLQGKLDAQITPEINSKLSKSGDTMSGNLNMGENSIDNVNTINLTGAGDGIDFQGSRAYNLPTPTNNGDAANKQYVDGVGATAQANAEATALGYVDAEQIRATAAEDALNASKLNLNGGTMSGHIDMANHNIMGADTLGTVNLEVEQIYSENPVGVNIDLDFKNSHLPINLPAPTNSGDATNKQYVDDADALKLDLSGGTMSGNIDMDTNNITNIGQVRTYELKSANSNPNASISVLSKLFLNDKEIEGVSGIFGLLEPTSNDAATNKTYVDNKASTAESNANAYTDTAIAAQKFTGTIQPSDWTLDGSFYYVTITHNLNSDYLLFQAYLQNYIVEFNVNNVNSNVIELASNIPPTDNVNYRISK